MGWLWCILFGAGTLLWQQVVTSVPTRSLPKDVFQWGSGEPQDTPLVDDPHNEKSDGDGKDSKRTGQILWIRGLTRLQTQIRVVNAFRQGVDGTQMQQAASNQNVQRVLARQV